VEAAQAAGRSKQTYLGALHRRLVTRRGQKRAVVAVGHAILVIVHQLLRQGTVYVDLGPTYFDERNRQLTQRRLVRRLEQLRLTVTVQPTSAAG
jgi:transposase